MIGEKRRLFKIWKKSKTEEDRALYCIAKRNARKAVYVVQSDEQKVFGGMLDSEFEQGSEADGKEKQGYSRSRLCERGRWKISYR